MMTKQFMLERIRFHHTKMKQDRQFETFHLKAIAYYKKMIKELKREQK